MTYESAMQAPTERNPDYRTREWREAEVMAQIELDGGLTREWIERDRYRPCAVDRLVRAGRVRLRVPMLDAAGRIRYEVVKPAAPSVWSRLAGWLGGLAS